MNKVAFSTSHDYKSKNYPIALQFGTDVAFIIFRYSWLPKKMGPLQKKIFEIKNSKKKKFESRLLREYLIYRLKILTTY